LILVFDSRQYRGSRISGKINIMAISESKFFGR
jgi:hypothetical protein